MANYDEEVATRVLALAAMVDRRIPAYDPGAVQAWAFMFEGQGVFVDEAREAVRAHYRKPNAFPIQPGDVIDHCRKMPVNSSRERLAAEITKWSQYPYSGRVQELTGMAWEPTFPAPDGVHGDVDAEREFHRNELRQWIQNNGEHLLDAGMNIEQKALTQ
nr:hypothetical protein [Rhodococcus sp. (in: high G+C Gram-positive bacteria)]